MTRSIFLAATAALALSATPVLAQDAQWARYDNPAYGFSAELPLGIFSPASEPTSEAMLMLEAGGAGQLSVYAGPTDGLSLDQFASQLQTSDQSRSVTYRAGGNSWIVLSGFYGEDGAEPLIYYTKLLLSADRETFSGFEISFPAADKPRFESIVDRIEDTFTRPS
jgi:hypothetical protein